MPVLVDQLGPQRRFRHRHPDRKVALPAFRIGDRHEWLPAMRALVERA